MGVCATFLSRNALMLNILVRGHAGAEGYRGSAWVMPDMALRPWERTSC